MILLVAPFSATGFAEEAARGEGVQVYSVPGLVNETIVYVVIITELGNLSKARGWEVGLIIQTLEPDVRYNLKIVDSHKTIDEEDGELIDYDHGQAEGSKAYGPWYVWAGRDLEIYGNLIWEIKVMDFYRDFVWFEFIMSWGWGDNDPLGIIEELPTGLNLVPSRTVVFVFIALLVAVWKTYSRSINSRIKLSQKLDESEFID